MCLRQDIAFRRFSYTVTYAAGSQGRKVESFVTPQKLYVCASSIAENKEYSFSAELYRGGLYLIA